MGYCLIGSVVQLFSLIIDAYCHLMYNTALKYFFTNLFGGFTFTHGVKMQNGHTRSYQFPALFHSPVNAYFLDGLGCFGLLYLIGQSIGNINVEQLGKKG